MEAEVHRLSYQDVMRMVDAGVFDEDDRVELIDGVLVDMNLPGAPHSAALAWLNGHFAPCAPQAEVRIQDVLIVEGGFFLPDLMVVEPQPRDRHPATAFLVAEIALTSQSRDRWKACRYAVASVGEYWLVDLPARTVIVHRDPSPKGYRQTDTYRDDDSIDPPVAIPAVDVSALLGPSDQPSD